MYAVLACRAGHSLGDLAVKMGMLMRVHVTGMYPRIEQSPNLSRSFALDLFFGNSTAREAQHKCGQWIKVSIRSNQVRNLPERRNGFAFYQIEVGADLQSWMLLRKGNSIRECLRIGHQRSARDNPALEGLNDPAIHAGRVSEIVRINDELLHAAPMRQGGRRLILRQERYYIAAEGAQEGLSGQRPGVLFLGQAASQANPLSCGELKRLENRLAHLRGGRRPLQIARPHAGIDRFSHRIFDRFGFFFQTEAVTQHHRR